MVEESQGEQAKTGWVGAWIDRDGSAHICRATPAGERQEEARSFAPLAWSAGAPEEERGASEVVELSGTGSFDHLLRYADAKTLRSAGRGLEVIRPLEHAFLLDQGARLFTDLTYKDLRIASLSTQIAEGEEEALAAIALMTPNGDIEIRSPEGDEAPAREKQLLFRFQKALQNLDPDCLVGHDLFNGDLALIIRRCRAHKVPLAWGRFGQKASSRRSRVRIAERWIDFDRVDVPGRALIDLSILTQLYDVSLRALEGYDLDTVAEHFGLISEPKSLKGDIVETRLRWIRQIADILLPTYVAQARSFPMLLQEVVLRGSATKVDLLLTEPYLAKRASLPDYPEVTSYEGAFTKTFRTGVFEKVLHFDIASLYPSLLLQIGRNPSGDHLGVFIDLLRELRTYRLRFKELARSAPTAEERQEAQARQTSYKIIINSFYGYLGFAGGRFADSDLAAEVTKRGRDLIQDLIARFEEAGHPVIEADTDGMYVVAGDDAWEDPDALLQTVAATLPEGIDLEYDGRYEAMFSYKAKNYALRAGDEVTVRGSALRSRGMEPFLRRLQLRLIGHLLGEPGQTPTEAIAEVRETIASGKMPVADLAKAEYLSQTVAQYRAGLEGGGRKPRRASLEAADLSGRSWRMGERIQYYLTTAEKARAPDWQRARPLEEPFIANEPYDPKAYLKRLTDWEKRYADFLPQPEEPPDLLS